MNMANMIRGVKFAAVVMATLAIAGCAKNADQNGAMAGAAAPGSQQDFVVNVGDRVFFETDSSELTDQSRATLDKQAQWLSNYNRYSFTVEGHAADSRAVGGVAIHVEPVRRAGDVGRTDLAEVALRQARRVDREQVDARRGSLVALHAVAAGVGGGDAGDGGVGHGHGFGRDRRTVVGEGGRAARRGDLREGGYSRHAGDHRRGQQRKLEFLHLKFLQSVNEQIVVGGNGHSAPNLPKPAKHRAMVVWINERQSAAARKAKAFVRTRAGCTNHTNV